MASKRNYYVWKSHPAHGTVFKNKSGTWVPFAWFANYRHEGLRYQLTPKAYTLAGAKREATRLINAGEAPETGWMDDQRFQQYVEAGWFEHHQRQKKAKSNPRRRFTQKDLREQIASINKDLGLTKETGKLAVTTSGYGTNIVWQHAGASAVTNFGGMAHSSDTPRKAWEKFQLVDLDTELQFKKSRGTYKPEAKSNPVASEKFQRLGKQQMNLLRFMRRNALSKLTSIDIKGAGTALPLSLKKRGIIDIVTRSSDVWQVKFTPVGKAWAKKHLPARKNRR